MGNSSEQNGGRAADDAGELCRRFRVTGHVQGVFFRASTRTVARDLGLGGYAKNLEDGTVEVLACGSAAALQELERWLQAGPPMAQVRGVTSEHCAWRQIDDFTTA